MDKTVRQTEPSLKESAEHLSPGQIINERYQILSTVGQGGMGVVYRVKSIQLDTDYALKTLDKGQISDISWRRFQQEAKAASKLDHPNLIRVHELDLLDGSQPYFVMDFVEGTTLSKLIRSQGPLSIAEALPLFIQVCFGLAYAHQKGVIHRDLKPSNIMIVDSGGTKNVKIVDFGIAKLTHAEGNEVQGLTRTGEIFGSPLYMSPEQCLGQTVDKRSDVYSLGCVMFEALTGMPPFLGDSALATMMKHQSEAPPTLKEASLGREFPAELEGVVARLLMKEPDRRYQNLLSVAQDLGRIQRGEEISRQIAEKAASKSSTPPRTVPVAAAVLMATAASIATALGTIILVTPKEHEQPALEESQKPHDTVADPNQRRGLPIERSDLEYFSRIKEDGRTFTFPGYLGLYTINDKGGSGGKLEGSMFLPRGDLLGVSIDTSVARDPLILKCFRHDEVCSLNLDKSGICDASLYYLPLLKSIRNVRIANTDTTNDALNFIGELPRLESLNVAGTQIDGTGLSRMRNLKNLSELIGGRIENMTPLLDGLRHAPRLAAFFIEDVKLTDENYHQLARVKAISRLGLGGCRVSARGLNELSIMPGLTSLDLDHCEHLPEMLGAFRNLKRLRSLVLPRALFENEKFMAELKKAMPQCQFNQGAEHRLLED